MKPQINTDGKQDESIFRIGSNKSDAIADLKFTGDGKTSRFTDSSSLPSLIPSKAHEERSQSSVTPSFMKKSAQALCVGLLLSNALTSPVLAQTTDTNTDTPVPSSTGTAQDLRVLPRIGAGFTTTGAGYEEPFFSLEGFVPLYQTPGNALTFLEGKLLLLTDSTMGGNLVLGQRFYSASHNRILGGYISYDVRDTGNNVFHQIGAGFERLGNWDLRVNAYLPVGNTREQTSESITDSFFQQNFLVQNRERRFEAAMAGVDVEAGGRLLRWQEGDLRGYAGVYYYGAEGSDDAFGVKGRLEARANDNLRLGLSVQHDRLFDTRVIFNLGFNFPGTRPRGVNNSSALARMGESVGRTATITVDEQKEEDTLVATNPKTGQPWRFRHVNLGIGTGEGTFENPAGRLEDALNGVQPDDIVYVQAGTNPGIPSFTIPDRVSILSVAVPETIETVEFSSVRLPLSGSGVLPEVRGTVTMGNDTSLSGFAIANATGNAIQATTIQNVTIQDNRITNATGQGISLNDVSGTNAIARNIITNSGQQGISIQAAGTTQQQVTLDSNEINGSGSQGIFLQASGNAQQQLTASSNSVSNSVGQGIFVQANDNSQQELTLEGSTINGTTLDSLGEGGQGLFVQANGSAQQTFDISSATVNNAAAQGLLVSANGSAQQTFELNSTTVENSGSQGLLITANGDENDLIIQSRQTFTINGAQVSTSAGQGLLIGANNNSQQDFTISNSTINGTTLDSSGIGGQGLFVQANGVAQQNFTLDNTTVSESAGQGLFVQASGSAQQTFDINSSTVNNSATQGLLISANESAQQTFEIANPTVMNSGGQGLLITANGDESDLTIQSQQTFTVDGAQVSNNAGQGLFVGANNNSQQDFTISNSTINGTTLDSLGVGGQGVFVQANGVAQQNFTLDNTTVSESAGQGLFVQASGSAQQTFDINRPTVNNSATQGLLISANGSAQQNFDIISPTVSNSGGQGLLITANGDESDLTIQSRQTFTVDGAQVNNNAGQGMFVSANNNSQQDFTISNSTINGTTLDSSGNGGQGVFVQANGVAQQNVTINNTTVSNSAGQGIFVQANGNAQSQLRIGNNAIANSAATGIFLVANENARIDADVQFNILKDNAIPGFNATMNSAQTFCLGLNGNNSNTDFQLQQNAGTFQVVNRDNVSGSNTGTVNFQPGIGGFTDVPSCP